MSKKQFSFVLFSIFLFFVFISQVSAATVEPMLKINGGARTVTSRRVTLTIIPTKNAREMRISNEGDFAGASWEPVDQQKEWVLSFGGGTKVVYAQFRDNLSQSSEIIRGRIILSAPQGIQADFSINNSATTTNSRYVTLKMTYGAGVELVALNNTNSFDGVQFQPIEKTVQWILSPGSGQKTVYAKFKNTNGDTYIANRIIIYQQPDRYIEEGTILRGQSDSVYYLGFDGRIHPFIHSAVYHSFYQDFSKVTSIGNQKLREYLVGSPVCVRQGTWLLQFTGFAKIYAVEPGCMLRPLRSEVEAYVLYGPSWVKRVVRLDPVQLSFYQIHEVTTLARDKDQDRDGISRENEIKYGTSDGSVDSDNDKLSDYEEISYWFSDPTLADTDGDGVADGVEILQNQNPVGVGTLQEIPEGAYTFPYGSVVYRWWDNKKYYYSMQDGRMYFLADAFSMKAFISNNFQSLFVISPPSPIDFEPQAGSWRILEDHPYIKSPLTRIYNTVTPL